MTILIIILEDVEIRLYVNFVLRKECYSVQCLILSNKPSFLGRTWISSLSSLQNYNLTC